ncbi:MAG: hypothetical protein ABSF91_13475 [Bacteroidota bacterium]
MKYTILTFAVVGFMAGTLLMGCKKSSEQKVEASKDTAGQAEQDLKKAQTDYRAEWQTFKTESEQKIDANEKRIDAFKEKIEKAGTKVKRKYNKAVAELEQKNRDLRQKLEDYKDDGQTRWEEFKTNFSNDMDSLGTTIKDLFKDND